MAYSNILGNKNYNAITMNYNTGKGRLLDSRPGTPEETETLATPGTGDGHARDGFYPRCDGPVPDYERKLDNNINKHDERHETGNSSAAKSDNIQQQESMTKTILLLVLWT